MVQTETAAAEKWKGQCREVLKRGGLVVAYLTYLVIIFILPFVIYNFPFTFKYSFRTNVTNIVKKLITLWN